MTGLNFTLAGIKEKLSEGNWKIEKVIARSLSVIEEKENLIAALLPEKERSKRLEQDIKKLKDNYCAVSSRPELYGVPVAVKDIFHLNGFKTRAGSQLEPDLLTEKEGFLIKKLRSQGALFLGKTVTTEFAHSAPGPTRNPHNLEHTPGGSSSGSAAAVAAGYCPLALGTQTIGSVIRPAAFCGIIGFKPTQGRIPADGLIKFSETVDQVGFFTRSISGAEIAFTSLLPSSQFKKVNKLPTPVLALPDPAYLNQAGKIALRNLEDSQLILKEAGFQIKKTSILNDIAEINDFHRILIAYEFASFHKDWYREYKDLYRAETAELIKEGLKIKEEDYLQAKDKRLKLKEKFKEIMNEEGIDIFISPSATGPAPEGLKSTGNPVMNLPWTNVGLPAITVPSGKTDKSLPLGLQLAASHGTDEKLLTWTIKISEILKER